MSGVAVQVDVQGLGRLQSKLQRLGDVNKSELLAQVGAAVESQTKRRIQSEKTAPDGTAWTPWLPKYAATRHGGQSLLQGEGNLLESIQYAVSGDELEVGTNLIYGATHQLGDPSRNIIDRPYLGLSPQNEQEVIGIVENYLDAIVSG